MTPERTGHGVDQGFGVGRPGGGARSGGELGKIHFSEIIRMRHVNLFEDWFTLGKTMRGGEEGCEQNKNKISHKVGW